MSGKLSQKTFRGKLLSEKVVAAIDATDEEKASAALAELYAAVLGEGEEMPDWAFLLELDKRLIAALSDKAEDADRHRNDSIVTRVRLTTERNTKVAFLRAVVSGIQRRVRVAYGFGALAPLGLEKLLSEQPEALVAETIAIRRRCLTPELQPTSLEPGAEPFDWDEVAREIERPTASLATSISSRKDRQEAAVSALIDKHAQQDQQYLGHTFVVQRVVATFRMAGLKEEASRLRLTIPRSPESPSESPEGQVEGQTPEGDPSTDEGGSSEGGSSEGGSSESDPPGVPTPLKPVPDRD